MDTKEVQELVIVLNKILQGYRLRLRCLEKRKEVIDRVLSTSDPILGIQSVMPRDVKELRILLKHEKKILKIVESENELGENLLQRTNRALLRFQASLDGAQKEELKKELAKYGLKLDFVRRLILSSLDLLYRLGNDLSTIKKRMREEEALIVSPSRMQFSAFFLCFERELGDNDSLLIYIENFRKKHESMRIFDAAIINLTKVNQARPSDVYAFASGAILGNIRGDPIHGMELGAGFSLIASLLAAIGGFVNDLNQMRMEESKTMSSAQLIRKINDATGRKHWWNRLF